MSEEKKTLEDALNEPLPEELADRRTKIKNGRLY